MILAAGQLDDEDVVVDVGDVRHVMLAPVVEGACEGDAGRGGAPDEGG